MIRPDPGHLDDLIRKIENFAPQSLKSVHEELRRTVAAGVEGLLQRMNLVTREEFDVQAQLLARCQERLAELQKRLKELE